MKDDVLNAGEPAMGTDIPIENTSGSVNVVGTTVRHTERGKGGKFRPREARIVGPLNKPTGPGGYDSVVGHRPEGWLPGMRDSSVLHEFERVHQVTTRPYFEAKDYSQGVDPARKSHEGVAERQDGLNHIAQCPACATGGACNG